MYRFLLALSLFSFFACGDDDAPMADAGADASFDTGPRCSGDPECDDGLFCTGVETCDEGVCRPGTTIVCDDEIICTIDACNEITDRCEGLAPDRDEDGAGDRSCLDAEGEPLGRDCDDDDPARFGGNREVCDTEHVDEDCDASTFGAVDNDDDGYNDARCQNTAEDGTVNRGDDCDDGRRDVNPATTEVCDEVDNNCNGDIDEGVLVLVSVDADRDGFPANDPEMACPGRAGLVAIDDDTVFDCDDDNAALNPGQVEVCDMADNDCDGRIDEAAQAVDWYRDVDGDGFGSADSGVTHSCVPVEGSSLLGTDCDDSRAGRNPAAAEVCNGIDDDCNGRADYRIGPGDFEDDDGDGSADILCGGPRGVDCDDRDARTAGGNAESCDGRDNDCDGRVDENADALQWFYDGDGDGHGTLSDPSNPPVVSCSPPARYVGSGGDCDDSDAARFPGALEQCGGIDDDCDGAIDEALIRCDCPDGFTTCPGESAPGCFTNMWNDTNNCGGCGTVCGEAHTDFSFCNRGVCVLDCDSGYEDCSAVPGCETPTDSDDMNCGDCGRMCDVGAGERCRDGRCGHGGADDLAINWLYTYGGAGDDQPALGSLEVAADNSQNTFVATNGNGALTLGGITHAMGAPSTLIFMLTPTRDLNWVVSVRSGGQTTTHRIATIPTGAAGAGDVIIAGTTNGNAFSAAGSAVTDANASCSGFVARLRRAGGAPMWVRLLPAVNCSTIRGLDVSPGGDILVAGGFETSLDLDGIMLNATANLDAFVARVNPATGAFSEAFSFGDRDREEALDVVALGGGDIAVVGSYLGSFGTMIGDASLPLEMGQNGFYAVFSSGTPIHAGYTQSTGDDYLTDVERADIDGEYFIAGTFQNDVSLFDTVPTGSDPGPASRGLVLARVNTTGGLLWISGLTGAGADVVYERRARFVADGTDLHFAFSTNSDGVFAGISFPAGLGAHIARVDAATGLATRLNSYTPSLGMQAMGITLDLDRNPIVVGTYGMSDTMPEDLFLFDGQSFVSDGRRDQFVMRLR